MLKQQLLFNKNLHDDDPDYRRLVTSAIVIYLSFFVFSFFALYNFSNNPNLFYLDTSFIGILLFLLFYFRKTNHIDRIAGLTSVLVFVAVLEAIYINKVKDFMFLWSFIYPFIVMILLGYKRGSLFSSALFLILFIMIYQWVGIILPCKNMLDT